MTNSGYTDDASDEVEMQSFVVRLRLGMTRHERIVLAAPAAIQARLAKLGVWYVKRLQRRCAKRQIAVSKPRWDVVANHESIRYPRTAACYISWADISGMIEKDEPHITIIPDSQVVLSIPARYSRAARRTQ